MIEWLLIAALTWPSECVSLGEVYRDAARVRDHGWPLPAVLKMTESRRIRLALIHTYERKDMTPNEWYWLAVGICVGQSETGAKRVTDGQSAAVLSR